MRIPIATRIRQAWKPGISYHGLMFLVFPPKQFPKAHSYQHNGGPPGCAMAFGKALRKLGLRRSGDGKTIEGTIKPK